MRKKTLNRDFLILSILSVITVFTWIGLEVYQTLNKTEIPSVLQRQIEPLNPVIETDVVQGLKSRKSYSAEELVTAPLLPEETVGGEIPAATESGEGPEASPSAD
jgi:hypothetical protein